MIDKRYLPKKPNSNEKFFGYDLYAPRDISAEEYRNRKIDIAKNYNGAIDYVLQRLYTNNREGLNEQLICDIHRLVSGDSIIGGVYRHEPVYIADASHDFPLETEVPFLMKKFIAEQGTKNKICNSPEAITPMELAAWTHNEFVMIHPFLDGNGRAARLLMNYQLLSQGYLPINIPVAEKPVYFKLMDCYYSDRDIAPTVKYFKRQEAKEIQRFEEIKKSRQYNLMSPSEKMAEQVRKSIRPHKDKNIDF